MNRLIIEFQKYFNEKEANKENIIQKLNDCSIAGLTVNLLKTSEKKILKFAFIIVSILSGIIFYLITTDIFIQYREHFYMGLYCIIAGWIFSIIGILNIMVTKK